MEKNSLKAWNPFSDDSDEDSGHTSPVMALLPIKGNILASADISGCIYLWNIPQNTIRRKLNG